MDSKNLKGKAYVVTGGARGIGRSIAEHLAAQGGRVAILDADLEQGRREEKRLGRGARFIECDLGEPLQVRAAADALKSFPRLDGLVNNAGISGFKAFEAMGSEDWNRVLDVNLRGAFLASRLLLPRLKPGSAIVNISSTRALMSEESGEAYAASKGGLLSLTHALAVSLSRRRIRVNALAPGWIDVRGLQGGPKPKPLSRKDHAQHPVGRVGRPEDVAEAALFLLDGKRSGFITGQKLVVDGGMSVKMIYED
jgi:NAD(P)-dependent dehydrogenase (short-subunit alcohol dehydrogenase family)